MDKLKVVFETVWITFAFRSEPARLPPSWRNSGALSPLQKISPPPVLIPRLNSKITSITDHTLLFTLEEASASTMSQLLVALTTLPSRSIRPCVFRSLLTSLNNPLPKSWRSRKCRNLRIVIYSGNLFNCTFGLCRIDWIWNRASSMAGALSSPTTFRKSVCLSAPERSRDKSCATCSSIRLRRRWSNS